MHRVQSVLHDLRNVRWKSDGKMNGIHGLCDDFNCFASHIKIEIIFR